MTKASQIPNPKNFYRLPFEKGTFELTEQTLNLNSDFRKPNYFYSIKVRNIHFRNEILTLGVKLEDEQEKLIYLKVTQHELLVSCNVDTDSGYLSRYAYFGLLSLLDFGRKKCFKKYYWPDFFDPKTGKSKFLKIYNDRMGLDIYIKPKYPHFYKPGDKLIKWHRGNENSKRKPATPLLTDELPSSEPAIGYFIADVKLSSIHSNHYPFLVPFLGIPTKDKQRIKSYVSILLSENDLQSIDITPTQQQLNAICFRMRKLAPVESRNWQTEFSPNSDEKENGSLLMELWHEAKPIIQSQKYIHYYNTHGLVYLPRRPSRNWVRSCAIRTESPKLVILLIDKGEYYLLELRFRVNKKLHIPEKTDIAFFICGTTDPKKLYLLDRFTDYQLTSYFAMYKYRLAVLKCHYRDELKDFVEKLATDFELIKNQ
ncbi:hypothetical protein [Algoriphagus sp. Y33]|uniref:hypothetical protein n=1 Tax=Algoriphagus sp. Y33 TaxID=2772483 RepID=UPI0017871B11|nr:hypothetical protein [Algoriphagus sp. Y33]